jgi:hypothetical protein
MRLLVRLLPLMGLLLGVPALGGGVQIGIDSTDGHCNIYKLCDDETTNGTCGGSGTERYFAAKGFNLFLFMADTSDDMAGSFTVKLYGTTTGQGYSANRTYINEDSGDLTESNPWYVWFAPLGDVHADVTATNGVTLLAKACITGR